MRISLTTGGGVELPQRVLEPGTVRRLGEAAKALILQRVRAGLDLSGQPFKPYSTRPGWFRGPGEARGRFYAGGYREFKEKLGHPTVDLTLTGRMLRALQVRSVGEEGVALEITGPEGARAAAHEQGSGRLKARVFLGVLPESPAGTELRGFLEAELRRALGRRPLATAQVRRY